jgi:hypothetical protein
LSSAQAHGSSPPSDTRGVQARLSSIGEDMTQDWVELNDIRPDADEELGRCAER